MRAPMKFSLNHSDDFRRDATVVDRVANTTVLAYSKLGNLQTLEPWLANPYHRALIGALKLEPAEYVHVHQNGIDAAILPESAVPEFVMRLEAIVAALPPDSPERVLDGVADIPESLQTLVPFLEDWAISDDASRAAVFGHASRRRLRKLRAAVEPLLHEINSYLASFGDKPLTSAAARLADLAQAISELRAREA